MMARNRGRGLMVSVLMAGTALTASGANAAQAYVSTDGWGPWFRVPNALHDWCRNYVSVTSGGRIKFRAYTECKRRTYINILVSGLRNGSPVAHKTQVHIGWWWDVTVYANNRKGVQKWCGVAESIDNNY